MKKRTQHFRRRGLTSVLAMIYLCVMAALAVGFYASIQTGMQIADNEQYIHHASTASEASLAFARYQIAQLSLPSNTSQSEMVAAVYTALAGKLNGTANMGGNNPAKTNGVIQFPGPVNGSPTWMNTDAQGGQMYVTVSQIPNTMNLQVLAVAQNTNARVTPLTRKLQLNFNAVGALNPILNYGLVSYGEIMINNQVNISGNNGGVLVVASSGNPINVNNKSAFAGDFYYTDSTALNKITWGSLTVDGYVSSSGSFSKHVHPSTATPTLPTVDTSSFAPYCTAAYGGGTLAAGSHNQATVTNTILASGAHVFNNPVTIKGILYLDTGASLTFNNTCTIDGCIVQQNTGSSSTSTLIFDNTVTNNAMSTLSGPDFPAGELALSGSFLLTPNYDVTVNNTIGGAGTMIADSFIFNNKTTLTLTNGSLISVGANKTMLFNNAANITVTTTNTSPAGVGGGNITYTAVPSTYTEVYP